MSGLFLDSAGWFAAISPREKGHPLAKQSYAEAAQSGLRLVTTALVIAEVHSLVLRWRDPVVASRFLEIAFDADVHSVIEADRDLTEAAIARWIRPYDDQSFSLCDAVSFQVMRQERVTRCLTFDRHFAVAGYQILP